MRLSDEQLKSIRIHAEDMLACAESDVERDDWKTVLDLCNTIEALQEENEQLKTHEEQAVKLQGIDMLIKKIDDFVEGINEVDAIIKKADDFLLKLKR